MFQTGCRATCGDNCSSTQVSGCSIWEHDNVSRRAVVPTQAFWRHSLVGAAASDRQRAATLESGASLGHRCALLPRVCLSRGWLHLHDDESAMLAAKVLDRTRHPYHPNECPIRHDDVFRVNPALYWTNVVNVSRALALAWLPVDVSNFGENYVNSIVPIHEFAERLRGETFALRPMLFGSGASAASQLLQAMAEEPVATWNPPSPECFERLAVCRLRGTFPGSTYPGRMRPWSVAQSLGRRLLGAAQWELGATSERQVVYVKRRGKRRILNLPSLASWCTGGVLQGTSCRQWEFGGGLAADMGAMRQASVLVGMHGAGLANAFFMPRGSSVIEVRPYGFEGTWPDRYLKLQLGLEDALGYFQLSVGSPTLCGLQPAVKVFDARDRSCRVPRRGLERVFRSVKWSTDTQDSRQRRRDALPWTASIFAVYDDDEDREAPVDAPAAAGQGTAIVSFSPRFDGLPHIIDFQHPKFNKGAPCRGPNHRYKSGPPTGICGIEIDEWVMVDALISPSHSVIEFGARFGTTSCRLAHATKNSGNVVSVDPDRSAHKFLLENRELNRCNFHAVLGVVALKNSFMVAGRTGYDGYTLSADEVGRSGATGLDAVPSITPKTLQKFIGTKINALLIDCEGCIARVFETGIVEQVELVLMEMDQFGIPPRSVHYGQYSKRLRGMGFVRIWFSHDTFDPRASWSADMLHAAWAKNGTEYARMAAQQADHNLCTHYKGRHNLPDKFLRCATEDKGGDHRPNGG